MKDGLAGEVSQFEIEQLAAAAAAVEAPDTLPVVSKPIEVFGGSGKETRIVVRNWPDTRSETLWKVGTLDARGRHLQVEGWHRFEEAQPVGSLFLHVPERGALMIATYGLVDTLIEDERPAVLGAMVGCAQDIAVELEAKLNVGNGCLEWQLEESQIGRMYALFPTFDVFRKREGLRRGSRYLRRCP